MNLTLLARAMSAIKGANMLKLNIGLTRKVGETNYGSRGASINLEQELDSALVGDPAKLKERMRQLFAVVRSALAEELNGHTTQPSTHPKAVAPGTGDHNGHNGSPSNGPRVATASQVKAIYAIARSRKIDVAQFLKDRFNVTRSGDLSIKEASQAIDALKDAEAQEG